MGTPLNVLYKRFQTKVDEDLTNKESLIFSLVDVAISKSYKTCIHSLKYVLDEVMLPDIETYNGNFIEELDSDEIELLALWLLYEWNRRKQQRLLALRRDIGTTDFNRLDDKSKELREISAIMKDIRQEIEDLKNDFNTYKY